MNWNLRYAARTTLMRRSAVRELLKVATQSGMISFAGGLPAPELFPVEEIKQAADAVLRSKARAALQYGETEGVAELRDWIAARHSRPDSIVRRENVMIVAGSQQALDLIGKVFLDPGDRVVVENPTYLAALSAWCPFGAEFVPVTSDADGLDVNRLPALPCPIAKLIYCVPNFQNPQGTTLSLERRRRLVEWSRRESVPIIEDDPYGELRYEGDSLPSLLELDAQLGGPGAFTKNVIHLGTFSKVLAPGLRLGWVIAPAEVIGRLVLAKQSADLHTSTFCQHIALELVTRGVLERQISTLRTEYRVRRDAMMATLAAHFPEGVTWTRPAGGMFLLVTLPEALDASVLLSQALEQNVAFVPGEDFHLDGRGRNTMRLNFSNARPEQIEEGVKRLGDVVAESWPNA